MDHAQEVPAGAGGKNAEVPEKAQRRRFDAAYKLRILEEADRLTGSGEDRGRDRPLRAAPRTDPYVKNYFIRLFR